jgi:hypothetical protein
MSHHNNPLNDVCLEHIYATFELLGQFNNLEASSRALMLKNDAFSQTSSVYSAYLLRIVNMDSLYTSLQFSKPGFFRKNLLDQYLRLYNDLKKDESILSLGKNDHIYKIFLEYAKIRFELINIYGELSKANCNTYSTILDHIKILEWDNSQSNFFPSLAIGIIKEISIIKNLLSAQLSLIAFNFKNSVLYTYLAKNDLNQWINNLQNQIKLQQETETLETGKADLEIPNNQKWLKKFLSYTLAKINVYFNIILTKKSSEVSRQLNFKTDPDPLNMIKNFVSKNNNIFNISFIYSSNSKNTSIRPDGGYSCISTVPLTGIHSYPAIFSFPNEPPLNHWPNIISIIQSKQKQQHQHQHHHHHQHYSQIDSLNRDKDSITKYNNNNSNNNNRKTSSTLEYCNSVDSINSSFSSFSMISTATSNTNNLNNLNNPNPNNSNSNNTSTPSNLNPNNINNGVNTLTNTNINTNTNTNTNTNNTNINTNINTTTTNNNNNNTNNTNNNNNSSSQKISDSTSISSLSNAASYLIGARRFAEKRKRSSKSSINSNSNKDNSGMEKDTSQSLDETNTVPFFFYDWKISISYYMIKVDPEVIIVLIYECQNKDPIIIDFLTKLAACLRNVTLFEQLKVDW